MKPGCLLEAENLVKDFPGVRALDGVSLHIQPGEAIGLCGENGAGKSTLLNILSGKYPHGSYQGVLHWQGQPLKLTGPADAHRVGIRIIHQELSLAASLSIVENLFLGEEKTHQIGRFQTGWIRTQAQAEEARILLASLGWHDVDVHRKVASLPVGLRQVVEIAKAIRGGGKVLILDEPTSALSRQETDALLSLCRSLKSKGMGLIYVSHKLGEVFQIADRLVILRNGRSVAHFDSTPFDPQAVAASMVGRSLNEFFPPLSQPLPKREPVWRLVHGSVSDTRTGRQVLAGLDMQGYAGEIIGIAGLLGSGRTELMEGLFGLPPWKMGGEFLVHGQTGFAASPQAAMDRKMALIPEDRRRHGLHVRMPLRHNHGMAALERFTRKSGWLDQNLEKSHAQTAIQQFLIKAANTEIGVSTLSGGNQQKVVLAKWHLTGPDILWLDDPTRGVDVGAKSELYRLLQQWAEAGKCLVLASSENEEILHLCHRIYVLREGRCVGEFAHGDLDADGLLEQCTSPWATGSRKKEIPT